MTPRDSEMGFPVNNLSGFSVNFLTAVEYFMLTCDVISMIVSARGSSEDYVASLSYEQ